MSSFDIEAFVKDHCAAWVCTSQGYLLPFGEGYHITVDLGFQGVVNVGILTANSFPPNYHVSSIAVGDTLVDRIGVAAAVIIHKRGFIDLPDWLREPTAKAFEATAKEFEAQAKKMSDMALKIRQAQVSEV